MLLRIVSIESSIQLYCSLTHTWHDFFVETAPFKDLLNAGNVYDLNEQEKVRLVYVMQNQYRKKLIQEFEEVTKVYTQVIKDYSISVTPFCHFSLSLFKLQVENILKLYIRHI